MAKGPAGRKSRMSPFSQPPIIDRGDHQEPALFKPENLLREARRQRDIAPGDVPAICVLDPDGDILRNLKRSGAARPSPHWACYHSEMYEFEQDGVHFGIVGCAVGAPYAVLIAEQMFASGCRLLISVTSSGQITPVGPTPYFVLIDRAMRDEGTSYHYLPSSDFSDADPELIDLMSAPLAALSVPIHTGGVWTTDAPFRETETAIARARDMGLLAVEMEAAALYAFAKARSRPVVCFAHVTNQMAQTEGDFEKGEADGSRDALTVIGTAAAAWLARTL